MPRKEDIIAITFSLIGTAVFFLLVVCTWSAPITATVVDSETGQPIEDVVVVADWELRGGLEGGNPIGAWPVIEAVTDRKGKFHFPAWGPRFGFGILRDWKPELRFFKDGYAYGLRQNSANGDWYSWRVRSIVDGTTVKLERFRGTPKEYTENVDSFSREIDSLLFRNEKLCNWKNTPSLIRALDEQVRYYPQNGGPAFSSLHYGLVTNEEYYKKIGCGSAKEFLKGIAK